MKKKKRKKLKTQKNEENFVVAVMLFLLLSIGFVSGAFMSSWLAVIGFNVLPHMPVDVTSLVTPVSPTAHNYDFRGLTSFGIRKVIFNVTWNGYPLISNTTNVPLGNVAVSIFKVENGTRILIATLITNKSGIAVYTVKATAMYFAEITQNAHFTIGGVEQVHVWIAWDGNINGNYLTVHEFFSPAIWSNEPNM